MTDYTLHGKNVVHMTQGNDELHFFYDAQNKPAVVVYNGVPYSYVKNPQGDIVAILDANGTVVIRYVYDAWGRPISKTGTLASTLGTLQPFRYRGYVYDEETELYYLRSRYYNSCMCRFVNADTLMTGSMFAYCNSAPILQYDPDGFECNRCGQVHDRFVGEIGDPISHRENGSSLSRDGRMPMCQFMEYLWQMYEEKWQYTEDGPAYGYVDCVNIYRFAVYWYFNHSSYKELMVGEMVEGQYRNSVYNNDNPRRNVLGKGKITDTTTFVVGMALFRDPLVKDKGHVAIYVGNWFEGYENAVIEAVYGGVTIRELSESESINGPFTHYGYLRGIDYTN